MATISSIKYSELAGIKNAAITFDNGSGVFARLLRHTNTEDLILFSGKLVVIDLQTYDCETLATGVVITR